MSGKNSSKARHYVFDSCTYLYEKPKLGSAVVSSVVYGEAVRLLDQKSRFSMVETQRDGYVGWLLTSAIADQEIDVSHFVAVRAAPVFLEQNIKSSMVRMLPFSAEVSVSQIIGKWAVLKDGFHITSSHIRPKRKRFKDPVKLAEKRFMGTPYVWGGKCTFATDCSGMLHSCYYACGYSLPRDSGPQIQSLTPLDGDARRGAIAGFKGHIGMMVDEENLIHANAHTMDVAIEPLDQVIARVEKEEGKDGYLGLFQCPLGRTQP